MSAASHFLTTVATALSATQDWLKRLWFSHAFERRLRLVLMTIFLCGVSVAGVAYWKSRQSDYLLERSRLTHQVLQSFLSLSSKTFELYRVVASRLSVAQASDGAARYAAEDELISEISSNLKTLRMLVAAEISLVGAADTENEKEELERLAAIERRVTAFITEYNKLKTPAPGTSDFDAWRQVSRTLDSILDAEFRTLIKDGIADEEKEVAESDDRARYLIATSRRLITAASVLALLVTMLGATMLVRNIRQPLAELQGAMNTFAAGDFSRRVVTFGTDEFATLGGRFNEMARELESRRDVSVRTQTGLERKVEERTRSLAELNASLAAADQTRRRFLADLSHELRTPLTIIRGESEIMLRAKGANETEYRGALDRILEQSKHTALLVDDLLFIARNESGETRLKMQPLDLSQLLRQVCHEARPLCHDKGLSLTFPLQDAGPAIVLGDASRLKQVLLIIIDNAVRYARTNGTIETKLLSTPEGIALLVGDDGIGVPADDLPFVFERFYRGSNAGGQSAEGVGLGLPVAKAIVEAHGGTIAIESEAGRGTTVTVTLPFSQAPGQPRLRAVS